jgi:putative transposase
MLRFKAYRFRLEPTVLQARSLHAWSGALRFLWNWMLAQRRDAFRGSEGRVRINYFDQASQLPAMKAMLPWMAGPPSQSLQQTLRDLDRAFVNFYKGDACYPSHKRRAGSCLGVRWPQGVESNGRCVWLPKLGWVKARLSRKVHGAIKNATVRFDGIHWHVSIQVQQEAEAPARKQAPSIGIDVGAAVSLATSEGQLIEMPVTTEVENRRLAALARRHSRTQVGSHRNARARRRLLILRRRIFNRVTDFRHKLTTEMAKNHGLIVVEDLALRSLTRSARGSIEAPGRNVGAKARLNRSLLEQGHAETVRQLGYKLDWLGAELVKVPAAFTSQTCPQCRHVCAANRPARDRFQCVACGYTGHADIVAANNILAAGLAVTARRGSREPLKREPTRTRRPSRRPAGIPAL